MSGKSLFQCCVLSGLVLFSSARLGYGAEELVEFGFGKRDITPQLPMRLSGYSNRTEPAKDALAKLHTRALVMKSTSGNLYAIVSVDLLGLAARHNAELAKRIQDEFKIPRERLVVSCTHTHTGPQLTTPAANLLSVPFSEVENQRALDYEARVLDLIVEVVGAAIGDLKPGKMFLGEGRATFAMNRRTLVDGKWLMIHNPKGLVDHSLPVLKVESPEGKIRGLVFNYACHATTLGPNDNQYNPDWPGYAAKFLEEQSPGSTVLSMIGCGADANPEPRASDKVKDAVAVAMAHGRAAAEGVNQALAVPMQQITTAPACSFGYAPLAFDLPTEEELKARLDDKNPTIRHHAINMLEILMKKRMLPSTYPLPLQSWQFGNDLSMIFLGGEVVVDYALRLKKELTPGYVWVTAYTNDNPGYIASERVRSEGGYEVDYSMLFYNQPGRWSTGTEELIIKRIQELRENPQAARAREPDEALLTFHLPQGFKIEAIATEPLVMDPVNFAFGPDGKLWVVEMADYPRGNEGHPLGRVVWLEDSDRDGRFDRRVLFLDQLPYPNGVFPWRDGVLISAAPHILFARDTNGDGRADDRIPLYSGFGDFNPQHRMNGFTYGLDHRLYLAGGDPNRLVRSEKLGQDLKLLGGDFRIEPETGKIESETGHSQFGRARDDWGHWFGNDNSHPLFHYIMPEAAVARNPHVVFPRMILDTFRLGETPPVYPSSDLAARFNELHTANRFTSACSPLIFRDEALGEKISRTGFVCEPVHNLVQQVRLERDGLSFQASRIPSDENREFLASTDQWFRPVRVATGPDGALWVADMYRQIIEHPEWIPDHWQTQLDLRAGADRGRIYRIFRENHRPAAWPQLVPLSNRELVAQLIQANGTLRDMAQQLLIERNAIDVTTEIAEIAKSGSKPEARVHALWILHSLHRLNSECLVRALSDSHPQVVIQAIRIGAESTSLAEPVMAQLTKLAAHPDLEVRYELALALGNFSDQRLGSTLAKILLQSPDETWIRAAVLSAAVPSAQEIFTQLTSQPLPRETQSKLLEPIVATLIATHADGVHHLLELIAQQSPQANTEWPFFVLAAIVESLGRQNSSLPAYLSGRSSLAENQRQGISNWFAKARDLAGDTQANESDRLTSIRLLGRGLDQQQADLNLLSSLITATQSREIQSAALKSLEKLPHADISQLLISNWKQQSPATQTAIAETLLSRHEWTRDFVQAMEQGLINSRDLNAAERQKLGKHIDADLAQRASVLFSTSESASRQAVVSEYSDVAQLKGSDSRGAEIFQKSCAGCHKYRGVGNQIGGNLMSLQDRSSKALLTAILDPNQAVEGKFRSYSIHLKDGRVLTGLIVEESAANLILANSNGTLQALLRQEIDEISNSGLSFMPEGLERDLKPQDVADVITFLQADPNSPASLSSLK